MNWNDCGNRFHQRPSTAAVAGKLTLYADGVKMTDLPVDAISVMDNDDNTYLIRVPGLPKTGEDGEEIVYTVRIGRFSGYRPLTANGDSVTYTFDLFGNLRPIRPIKPIPIPFVLA